MYVLAEQDNQKFQVTEHSRTQGKYSWMHIKTVHRMILFQTQFIPERLCMGFMNVFKTYFIYYYLLYIHLQNYKSAEGTVSGYDKISY